MDTLANWPKGKVTAAVGVVALTLWGMMGKPGEDAIKSYSGDHQLREAESQIQKLSVQTISVTNELRADVRTTGATSRKNCETLLSAMATFNDNATFLKENGKDQNAVHQLISSYSVSETPDVVTYSGLCRREHGFTLDR